MGSILADAGNWVEWLRDTDWDRLGSWFEQWVESSFKGEGGSIPRFFECSGMLLQLLQQATT